jgi:hypothetical protein
MLIPLKQIPLCRIGGRCGDCNAVNAQEGSALALQVAAVSGLRRAGLELLRAPRRVVVRASALVQPRLALQVVSAPRL